MQILITPEDIIKRCLFTKYKKFVLKDMKNFEIDEWIEDNKPEVISENDAYVIGLLKTIETDNLIHRFRLFIEDFLKVKSTINNDKVIINKSALLKEIIEFKDMFPISYVADKEYQVKIDDMKKFVVEIYEKVDKLEIIEIMMHDKTFTYILSSDIQKMIKR
jgi:hypothetical protein